MSKLNFNTINMKRLFVFLGIMLITGVCFASGATSLGGMASSITKSFTPLAKLITGGCYVAGMGFTVIAIMKFKNHKDNPTQEPLSKPVVFLLVGAAMVFLPSILGGAGVTIFGSGAITGSPTGTIYSTGG